MYQEIQNEFTEYFPKGWMNLTNGCLGTGTVFVTFGMLSTDLVPNSIKQNDPCYNMVRFDLEADGTYTVEYCNGGLMVEPAEGSYLAMEHIKTRLRKRSGLTYEQLVKYLSKYFAKTRATVLQNLDAIYHADRYDFDFLLEI